MGSPLSPIIADIVLQDLEGLAIERLPCELTFYFRYVDDILISAPREFFDEILKIFNSLHNRLKFTLEINDDNIINFLNLTIRNINGKLTTDLFFKPTFSGRFLNFNSHHPLMHKKGVILGLVDKILNLSHPSFHEHNFDHIIKILLNNDYPLDFIFKIINNRIRAHNKNFLKDKNNQSAKKFFIIPYVKNISEKFNSITNRHQLRIAFSCNNKLNTFIKTGKDKLELEDSKDVVYRIDCQDCDALYIGQTKRKLKTRLKEHWSDINKKSGTPSVVSSHRLEYKHDFDWEHTMILDRESSYLKRLVSEMIHIKRHKTALNKQTDTECFPEAHLPILNKTFLI